MTDGEVSGEVFTATSVRLGTNREGVDEMRNPPEEWKPEESPLRLEKSTRFGS